MFIDTHIHTKPLSPCSQITPEEAIEEAKKKGLDGICFMEHDILWDESRIKLYREKHNFLVLRGVEVTTNYGHILVFGVKEWDIDDGDIYLNNGFAPYAPFDRLKSYVRRHGGVLVATHPFREPGYIQKGYGEYKLTIKPDDAIKRTIFHLIDAIEVFNGQSAEDENFLTLMVAKRLGLPTLGGSDAHCKEEVGKGITIFKNNISTEEDIISQLKTGCVSWRSTVLPVIQK